MNKSKGFTLIEMLLYVTIASAVIFVFVSFLQSIIGSRIKNQTVAEVDQSGMQVIQQVNQLVRNAASINHPVAGSSASEINLSVPGVTDPVVIRLASGTIQIEEGGNAPVALSSGRVAVTDLTFQNVSRADTPGTLKYQFTVTHHNPSGRNEYSFTRTFSASASVRD